MIQKIIRGKIYLYVFAIDFFLLFFVCVGIFCFYLAVLSEKRKNCPVSKTWSYNLQTQNVHDLCTIKAIVGPMPYTCRAHSEILMVLVGYLWRLSVFRTHSFCFTNSHQKH